MRKRRLARRSHPVLESIADMPDDSATSVGSCARLTGGDVDADWRAACAIGDEAVGGSTATPDQDVVDEIGDALGVAQAPDAEVVTTGEILAARDRHRWHLERDAMLRDEAACVAEEYAP